MCGTDGSRGQYHLGAIDGQVLPTDGVLDAGAAARGGAQPLHGRVRDDVQVRPVEERTDVGVGRALAGTAGQIHVTPPEPDLQPAADVIDACEPSLHRGVDARRGQGMGFQDRGDHDRPVRARTEASRLLALSLRRK